MYQYLGRVGTEVEMIFKRPSQPHPVTCKLRRQEGEYMKIDLPIPLSELQCNKHPWSILERIRFAEKTLLQLRFELEEWGAKKPVVRLSELRWHQSVIEDEIARFHHRLLKLAVDLGLNVKIYSDTSVEYQKGHKIRDPFSQLVWRGYFQTRPCVKVREFVAAVQNELRNFGAPLLSSTQALLMARLMGVTQDDCISAYDVQAFTDRWFPPCRFEEVDSLPWPHAGHGLVDALKIAESNLMKDQNAPFPDWFYPFLGYQEACYLLMTADPGTFVVRVSKTPGNFAIQWSSPGRQIKNAKVRPTRECVREKERERESTCTHARDREIARWRERKCHSVHVPEPRRERAHTHERERARSNTHERFVYVWLRALPLSLSFPQTF